VGASIDLSWPAHIIVYFLDGSHYPDWANDELVAKFAKFCRRLTTTYNYKIKFSFTL